MTKEKTAIIFISVIVFLTLLVVIGMELTIGLSLTKGLPNVSVKEIYVMGDKDTLYLSIDLEPSDARLRTIRVPLAEIVFEVNPALSSSMALSSADAYIWGDRWPWVKNVTITLKTGRQKEGFDKLFKPEKLQQLQADLAKVTAIGVTHFGLLMSGGRITEN